MAGVTDNFDYVNGNNKLNDIKARLNIIASYESASSFPNTTINSVLTITPSAVLPTSPQTGSLVTSGSGAALKLFIYNGTNWLTGSFSII